MINRESCCLCGGELSFLHSFNRFPIYMGITEKTEPDLFEDMEFHACNKCGCVQLKRLIDPSVLYKRCHNPAIGKTWEEHNRSLADCVGSIGAKTVLDIGGANMKIANMICESSTVVSYTVCDVSSENYDSHRNGKIKIINEIIENAIIKDKYDTIVLSHTFEHFYSPVAVLKKLVPMLADNGVIVISVPNIENQLKDGFLNAINFEHTYYINHEYVKLASELAGLKIADRKDFSKYNSFYTLSKGEMPSSFPNDASISANVYNAFVKDLLRDVANINLAIQDKEAYCFGAHIFTQMLLACGLNTKSIKGILDNDPNKIDKLLYGSDLKVFNPSVISKDESPIVILRAAQYKDEIKLGLITHNQVVTFV